jgi:hypothetical protein
VFGGSRIEQGEMSGQRLDDLSGNFSIQELTPDLDRLADFEHPLTDDAPYDRITYRVVDWYRAHPEPVPHEHDSYLQR